MKNLDEKSIVPASATLTFKSRKLLSRQGINSYITRPPKDKSRCQYCLMVSSKDYEDALSILRQSGIKLLDS